MFPLTLADALDVYHEEDGGKHDSDECEKCSHMLIVPSEDDKEIQDHAGAPTDHDAIASREIF